MNTSNADLTFTFDSNAEEAVASISKAMTNLQNVVKTTAAVLGSTGKQSADNLKQLRKDAETVGNSVQMMQAMAKQLESKKTRSEGRANTYRTEAASIRSAAKELEEAYAALTAVRRPKVNSSADTVTKLAAELDTASKRYEQAVAGAKVATDKFVLLETQLAKERASRANRKQPKVDLGQEGLKQAVTEMQAETKATISAVEREAAKLSAAAKSFSAARNAAVAEGRVFQRFSPTSGESGSLVNTTKTKLPNVLGAWMRDLSNSPSVSESKALVSRMEAQTAAWARMMEQQLIIAGMRDKLNSSSGRLVGSFSSEDALARTKQLYELESRIAANREAMKNAGRVTLVGSFSSEDALARTKQLYELESRIAANRETMRNAGRATLVGSFTSEDALARTKQLYELESRIAANRETMRNAGRATLVGSFTSEDALARTKQLYELESRIAANRETMRNAGRATLVGSFTSEDALARTKQLYELESRIAANRETMRNAGRATLVGSFTSEDALARTKQLYELESRIAANRETMRNAGRATLVGSFTSEDALARTKQLYELESRIAANRETMRNAGRATLVGSFTSEDALARTKQLYELESRIAANRETMRNAGRATLVGSFTSEDALARTKQLYELESRIAANRETMRNAGRATLVGSFTSEDALARTKQLYELESRIAANRETMRNAGRATLVGSFTSEDALARTKQLYELESRLAKNRELMRAQEASSPVSRRATSQDTLRGMREYYLSMGATSGYSTSSFDTPKPPVELPIKTKPAEVEKLSKSFRQLTIDGNDMHSMARGLASGFNMLWLTWGEMLPLLAGAAISFGTAFSVKMGAQVDHTLQTIRVLSGETQEAIAGLNDQLLQLASTGPVGPLEVAEAMKTLSLAGMSAGDVSVAIRDVMNFAVAGTTDLKQAADVMTSVATAFNVTATGFNYVGDVIAKTAAVSKASVESVGEAFKTASVIHKQFGVSLEDAGVGIAALANLGIQGTAAGTALRNMYTDLSGRTPKVTKAMNELGLELRDQSGKFKDLVTLTMEFDKGLSRLEGKSQKNALLTILSERGGKPMIELRQLVIEEEKVAREFAKRSGQAVVEGFEEGVKNRLQRMRDSIGDNAGFQIKARIELSETPLKQMETAVSALQSSLVSAFSSVKSEASGVALALQDLFRSDSFRSNIESLLQLTLNLAGGLVSLAKFANENAEVLATLTAAYVGLRLAVGHSLELMTFYTKAQTLATTGSWAATAAVTAERVAQGPLAVQKAIATSATQADTLATWANTGAKYAAITASKLFAAALPYVGVVLAVATGAWMLYESVVGSSTQAMEDAANSTASERRIKELEAETARLNENTDAMLANMTVEQLRASRAIKADNSDTSRLRAERDRYAKQASELMDIFEKTNGGGSPQAAVVLQAQITKAVNDTAKAETALTTALAAKDKASSKEQATLDASIAAAKRSAEVTKALQAARQSAAKTGTDKFLAEQQRQLGGTAAQNALDNDLRYNRLDEIAKANKIELDGLRSRLNSEAEALKDFRDANMVQEGEYQSRITSITMDGEKAQKAAAIAGWLDYAAEIDRLLRGLAAMPKTKISDSDKANRVQELNAKLLNKAEEFNNDMAKIDEEATKRERRLYTDQYKELDKLRKSNETAIANSKDRVTAILEEQEMADKTSGLGGVDLEATQARLKIELDGKKELRKLDLETDARLQASAKLRADAEAATDDKVWEAKHRRADDFDAQLRELTQDRADLEVQLQSEAAATVAAVYRKEFKRRTDELATTLSGALVDTLMNAGKEGGRNLRRTLEQELLAKPFRMVVQALIQPVAQQAATGINNFLGVPGGSGGNLLQTGANWLGSSSMFTSSASYGSILGSAGSQAGMLAAQTSGFAGSQAAMLAAQTAEFGAAGLALTAEAAGTAATAASTAATAASTLASAVPYVAAFVAVASLIESLDDSGTMHTGGLGSYSAARGAAIGNTVKAQGLDFNLSSNDYNASAAQASVAIATSVANMLDQTANAFGTKAGYFAATAFADDTSSDGAWGALMVKLGDKVVVDWKNGTDKWPGREFADGETGAKEYAAAIAKDMRDYLITQTPDWADQALNALGDSPTLEDLTKTVGQINLAATTMKQAGVEANGLSGWMKRIAGDAPLTGDALQAIAEYPGKLLELAGTSRDALVQKFTEGLLSTDGAMAAGQSVADMLVASIEQSMVGNAAAAVFDIVNRGIVTPLLDAMLAGQSISEILSQASIDATIQRATEAASVFTTILNDPTFKSALDQMKAKLGTTLGTAFSGANTYVPRYQPPPEVSTSASDAANELASETESLQDRLNAATLTRLQLLDKERAALDPSNRALFDSVVLAEEQKTLQDELNSLTLTRAQLLDLERANILPANQALFDELQLKKELKPIQDELNALGMTRQQQLEKELEGVLDANKAKYVELQLKKEAQPLEDELNSLTMSRIELLNLERDALLDGSKALFDTVNNLKDLSNIASTLDSVGSKFMSEQEFAVYRQIRAKDSLNRELKTSFTLEDIQAQTPDSIKALVRSYMQSGASVKSKDTVLSIGSDLLDVKQALIDSNKALLDSLASVLDSVGSKFMSGQEFLTYSQIRIKDQANSALGTNFSLADIQAQTPEMLRELGRGYAQSGADPAKITEAVSLLSKLIDLQKEASGESYKEELDALGRTRQQQVEFEASDMSALAAAAYKELQIAKELKPIQDELNSLGMTRQQLLEKELDGVLNANKAKYVELQVAKELKPIQDELNSLGMTRQQLLEKELDGVLNANKAKYVELQVAKELKPIQDELNSLGMTRQQLLEKELDGVLNANKAKYVELQVAKELKPIQDELNSLGMTRQQLLEKELDGVLNANKAKYVELQVAKELKPIQDELNSLGMTRQQLLEKELDGVLNANKAKYVELQVAKELKPIQDELNSLGMTRQQLLEKELDGVLNANKAKYVELQVAKELKPIQDELNSLGMTRQQLLEKELDGVLNANKAKYVELQVAKELKPIQDELNSLGMTRQQLLEKELDGVLNANKAKYVELQVAKELKPIQDELNSLGMTRQQLLEKELDGVLNANKAKYVELQVAKELKPIQDELNSLGMTRQQLLEKELDGVLNANKAKYVELQVAKELKPIQDELNSLGMTRQQLLEKELDGVLNANKAKYVELQVAKELKPIQDELNSLGMTRQQLLEKELDGVLNANKAKYVELQVAKELKPIQDELNSLGMTRQQLLEKELDGVLNANKAKYVELQVAKELKPIQDELNSLGMTRQQLLEKELDGVLNANKAKYVELQVAKELKPIQDELNSLGMTRQQLLEKELDGVLNANKAKYVELQVAKELKPIQDELNSLGMTRQQLLEKELDGVLNANKAKYVELQVAKELKPIQDELNSLGMTRQQLLEKELDGVLNANKAKYVELQVAKELKPIQDELNSLGMTRQQLLEKELDGVLNANKAKYVELQVAKELKPIQDELNSLGMTRQQLLEKELDGVLEVNKAKYVEVQVAKEAKSLQDELNSLTMTRQQLLEKELDGVLEVNKAKYVEVQVAKEAKTLQDRINQATLSKVALQRLEYDQVLYASRGLLQIAIALEEVAQSKSRLSVCV